MITFVVAEFKGHQILEAAKTCDSNKMKKLITPDSINFHHTITLDCPLVGTLYFSLLHSD